MRMYLNIMLMVCILLNASLLSNVRQTEQEMLYDTYVPLAHSVEKGFS